MTRRSFTLATCALVACTLLIATGCAGVQRLERAGTPVVLEAPRAWIALDAPAGDDALFVLHHETEPVRARVERITAPLLEPALPYWYALWARDAFDAPAIERLDAVTAPRDVHRVTLTGTRDGLASRLDAMLFHEAGHNYLVQFWGSPEAMDAVGDEARFALVAGLTFADMPAASSSPATADAPSLSFEPGPDAASARLELSERLLTAHVLLEELPYATGVERYAALALHDMLARADVREVSREALDDATLEVTLRAGEGPLAMLHVYRFEARGTAARQVIASTPAALEAFNADAIADVVRLAVEAK